MEKNTIDVLFLGSSVCVNAFNPQIIYDQSTIRSYNLGSEQQSIFLSYYWLKEAFRTQSPRVVVLETRFLFTHHPESPINTTEGLTRKCLDPMKWSPIKIEAIHNLCKIDSSQSELSYYFKNLRYHSGWNNINSSYFDFSTGYGSDLKGYSPLSNYGNKTYDSVFFPKNTDVFESPNELCYQYLIKIIEFCKERNVDLLLVNLPESSMTDEKNNTLNRMAYDYNVKFINLCEFDNYTSLNVSLPVESTIDHANLWGSEKISLYFANLLSNNYNIPKITDSQWESSSETYSHFVKNCNLTHVEKISAYIQLLNDPCYTVFISAHNNTANYIPYEDIKSFRDIGINTDLLFSEEGDYIAVISQGNVNEKNGSDSIQEIKGLLHTLDVSYSLKIPTTNYEYDKIMLNGQDYSKHINGINIVVYDNKLKKIIDCVSFYTEIENIPCIR